MVLVLHQRVCSGQAATTYSSRTAARSSLQTLLRVIGNRLSRWASESMQGLPISALWVHQGSYRYIRKGRRSEHGRQQSRVAQPGPEGNQRARSCSGHMRFIAMNYILFDRKELPGDENTFEFEGSLHQDTEVSFIWVDMPPGGIVRLHKHPYKEIFIIQEGQATFTVGAETLRAHAGQIIIVPADVPHKFMNASDRQLKQIDIHVNSEFITEWLEY